MFSLPCVASCFVSYTQKNILVNKPVQTDCMNGPCGLIEWYTVQTDYTGSLYKFIACMACTE